MAGGCPPSRSRNWTRGVKTVLKSWLAKQMRRVKLPDLLIEIDNQLGFTRNFLTPAQCEESSPEDIRAIFVDLLIHSLLTGRKSTSPWQLVLRRGNV
jgi:hypothetical protein